MQAGDVMSKRQAGAHANASQNHSVYVDVNAVGNEKLARVAVAILCCQMQRSLHRRKTASQRRNERPGTSERDGREGSRMKGRVWVSVSGIMEDQGSVFGTRLKANCNMYAEAGKEEAFKKN